MLKTMGRWPYRTAAALLHVPVGWGPQLVCVFGTCFRERRTMHERWEFHIPDAVGERVSSGRCLHGATSAWDICVALRRPCVLMACM